jgi:uncharacterized membrane protein required for colicin V production
MKPTEFNFGYNWFDLVVGALLIVGFFVGRKRGMSLELLTMLQWLAIVFLGALACDPLGRMFAEFSGLNPTLTYITAYLLTAVGIKILFVLIRRMAGEKLVTNAVFGNMEYYLGMAAGVVRFACILLFALALLNAPVVTEQELAAKLKHQQDWAGSIYFPPFGSVQKTIFEESLTGRAVKHVKFLSAQLINVDPSAAGATTETIGRRREREVDEIMIKR